MNRPAGSGAPSDTITAIATAAGVAAIGVIRISGPAAPSITEALLGRLPPARQATFASFRSDAGAPIDRGIALYFPAPRSFTGENMAEFHAHGGPMVLDMLLQRTVQLGARLARPGEFSERAFFNGKIDLTQAEAIADLISSGSAQAARAALASLQGKFSQRVQALAAAIDHLRVDLEAALDFPEESASPETRVAYGRRLTGIRTELDATLASAGEGQLLNDGVRVVIVGRPNAGKSSLFNCLARRDRAIVSTVAGTTRDTLDVDIDLSGLPVHLTDTAGLREGGDEIEREGMRRTRAALAETDHVLLLVPCDADYSEDDRQFVGSMPAGASLTVVRTKIDLCPAEAEIRAAPHGVEVWLSVQENLGVHLLERRIRQAVGYLDGREGAFSARRRHVETLRQTQQAVHAANEVLSEGSMLELAAEQLRRARQHLSLITGEYTAEDLLAQIFGSFCIGK